MIEGVYRIKLQVENSTHSDEDGLYIIVSETGEVPPTVKINYPLNNSEYIEGKDFTISASASSLKLAISKNIRQIKFSFCLVEGRERKKVFTI